MAGEYQIDLSPSAKETYELVRRTARSPGTDPSSTQSCTERLSRINKLLIDLMGPESHQFDNALLARMDWLMTRSLGSTLVYYFRNRQKLRVCVLHITESEGLGSYGRFVEFIMNGGGSVLSELGFELPDACVGPPAVLQ